MKVLETRNKTIDTKPFQLFQHDRRTVDYQEKVVTWSNEHLKSEAVCYQFRVREQEEVEYLPDACVNILFEIRENETTGKFVGLFTKATKIVMEPNVLYFGVKPYTNVGLRCKENDQNKLVDQITPLEMQFAHTEDLLRELSHAKNFQERMDLLLAYHRFIFVDETKRSVLAEYLSVLLCTETTAFSMEKIGRETGYSKRYTQRLFRKQIGVTPKQYSRIIRFQNAIKAFYFEKDITLAKVAYRLGYYDQAHLIHEFQLFTDMSPTKLLHTIQKTKELIE